MKELEFPEFKKCHQFLAGLNFSNDIFQDDYVGGNGLGGETKSELQIQQTSFQDNGTYYCQAENKAARFLNPTFNIYRNTLSALLIII